MNGRKPEIVICDDINGIAAKAAVEFLKIANSSLVDRGVFHVALSGGSTPRSLYTILSTDEFRERLDWGKVHLFWSDERCVPPDDVMSNYRMAFDSLIQQLSLPDENIHRIKGEMGEKAAIEYEKEIRQVFKTEQGDFPEFDLILLGMGEDGHIASIFPITNAAKEDKKYVTAITKDEVKIARITLTPPIINNSLNIIFMVTERSKASVLKEVIEGDSEPERFPAQITRNSKGRVVWFMDSEAAAELTKFCKTQTSPSP